MGQLEVLVPVVAASPGPEISKCTIFLIVTKLFCLLHLYFQEGDVAVSPELILYKCLVSNGSIKSNMNQNYSTLAFILILPSIVIHSVGC